MSTADELRLLRDAIKSFPDAIAVRSADGRIVACSDLYKSVSSPGRLCRTISLEGGASLELLVDAADPYHDALTALPNRRLLNDRLRQAIRLAQRRDRMVAAFLIHLDRRNDAALREVAERLTRCVRKADTLARSGADEFALVACDLKDEADCRLLADKLLQALAPELRVSVGVSLFPADGGDGEVLLRNADAAMRRARELGGARIRFFGK